MTRSSQQTASVSLTMTRVRTRHDLLSQIACMSCDIKLDLHQPNLACPDRLLGICEGCQRWYIVDLVPGEEEAVMVLVPDAVFLLRIGGQVDGH
jgi:hypothetical protein